MTQGFFEPCELHVLAEYLRDGTWLDMTVHEVGEVQRVRIIEVVVKRTRETIRVVQAYATKVYGVTGGVRERKVAVEVDRIARDIHEFDCDAVWRCKPTVVELLDVVPLRRPVPVGAPPPEPERRPSVRINEKHPHGGYEMIVEVVLATLAAATGFGVDELTQTQATAAPAAPVAVAPGFYLTTVRHQAIYMIYMMTDLSPLHICTKVFNYKSQTPYISARGASGDREWAKQATTWAGLVNKTLGRRPRRYGEEGLVTR